jgi:hypothetical protein
VRWRLPPAIVISRDLVFVAWPFLAGAVVCGLFAWQLFDDDGAEHAFVRATAASVLMAIGIYAVVVPALTPAFPSVALAEVLQDASCPHPVAASVGYEEPSLIFLTGTTTHFTDAAGAADFLRPLLGDLHSGPDSLDDVFFPSSQQYRSGRKGKAAGL